VAVRIRADPDIGQGGWDAGFAKTLDLMLLVNALAGGIEIHERASSASGMNASELSWT
jgi:hypothetical protein